MAQPKFEIVQEPDSAVDDTASKLLLLSLKALSQRALTAAAALFSLLTVASVFWLAMSIIHEPSTYQLVGLGGYSCFILAINWLVRRR